MRKRYLDMLQERKSQAITAPLGLPAEADRDA